MKKITAVLIGAGLRGAQVYAKYAIAYPNEFEIVGIAEPNEERRKAFLREHNIKDALQFENYLDLLKIEKVADCALVCTQDKMHYEPVSMALQKGYHVLCEKPMSPDKAEIVKMGQLAKKYDRILSICHVLRYSPFFTKIKGMLDEKKIGQLISVRHIEAVGYWHQAHSFVRGNWNNAKETSPMILAKCCHDMDVLSWLVGGTCESVSSFGDLTFFKKENAPLGAPKYCLEGCPHMTTCAYYAPKFYLQHPKAIIDGFVKAVSEDTSTKAILKALEHGPYGRCVFHCDNNVVDSQIVNMKFDNNVTVSMVMSAFTKECLREIHLMGTKGEIKGNMETGEIIYQDFIEGTTEHISLNTNPKGHSGSDEKMMRAFVELIRADKTTNSTITNSKTDASISVDSHLLALAAEESRVENKTIDFHTYKEMIIG